MVERVIATGEARGLLAVLLNRYGPIVLQLTSNDGGHVVVCRSEYDSSSQAGHAWLGCVTDVPVHSDAASDLAHLGHRLIIDVQPGAGPAGSLERSEGVKFVVRTSLMHPLERTWLDVEVAAVGLLPAECHEVSVIQHPRKPSDAGAARKPKRPARQGVRKSVSV